MVCHESQPCYDDCEMKASPPHPLATETAPSGDDSASVRRLVERAQGGDAEAFETLYRSHIGRIYALCLRMSGDPLEAEELSQQAFVRAWEKLDSFLHQSAFSSWLHRLTVNVVLGRWRSRSRRRNRVVNMSDIVGPGATSSEGSSSDVTFLEDTALEEASVRIAPRHPQPRLDLERAIAGLPTGARTVFILHDIEGYRHRDIAELTGLKEGTCKAQLHRARKLLREVLA